MASEHAHNAGELRQHPLVENLVPDPTQPAPPMKAFEGLLGKSGREGYWRLYLSRELNDYIEVKEEDVLNGVSIPQELSLLRVEATRVWLRRGAEIAYTHTQSGRAEEVSAYLTIEPGIRQRKDERACRIATLCCDTWQSEGGDPRASNCCALQAVYC